MLGQVVILRELNVAFYGIELIYILALGIWLFATATGAFFSHFFLSHFFLSRFINNQGQNIIRYFLVIFSITCPLEVCLIRMIRIISGNIPGAFIPFEIQIFLLFLAIMPLGIILGALFIWSAKVFMDKGGTLAIAYGIESIGSFFGGLASTILLWAGISNFTISLICGLSSALVAVSGSLRLKNPAKFLWLSLISLAVIIAALFLSKPIDHGLTSLNHPCLLASGDSPYGRITISEKDGQFILFVNDQVIFESQSQEPEVFVHMAALQSKKPKKILVAGGGLEGIITEILKHDPLGVDYVEINRVMFDMAVKWFPESLTAWQKDKRVRVYFGDPREFLKNSGDYDIIFVGASEPSSGGANRFYTVEFFRQCKKKLNKNGILALRLKSSENFWSNLLDFRNNGIFTALKSVFKSLIILPGAVNMVMASDSPLIKKPSLLIKRFEKRKIHARLVCPRLIKYLYTNDRFGDIKRRLSNTNAIVNSDTHPVCYSYTLLIWLSRFFPSMINMDISFLFKNILSFKPGLIFIMAFWIFCVPIFLMAKNLMAKKRKKSVSLLLVGLAGFSGMVLETMLIFHYQAKNGGLFQNLGILLMSFMLGMAMGSIGIHKISKRKDHKLLGIALVLGCALVPGLMALIFAKGYETGLFAISFLLFTSGFFTSAVFAWASFKKNSGSENPISFLYGADLLGGCFGSVLACLILIPFPGMYASAIFLAGLLLISVILV